MAIHSEPGFTVLPGALSTPLRVLVAEDPSVGSLLRTILQRRGHEVLVGDSIRGSEWMRRGLVKPELVITNDPETFLPFASEVAVLYIAANPDGLLADRFPNCRVLRKPFRNAELLEVVEELGQSVVR